MRRSLLVATLIIAALAALTVLNYIAYLGASAAGRDAQAIAPMLLGIPLGLALIGLLWPTQRVSPPLAAALAVLALAGFCVGVIADFPGSRLLLVFCMLSAALFGSRVGVWFFSGATD
jgi:hypothetical protein